MGKVCKTNVLKGSHPNSSCHTYHQFDVKGVGVSIVDVRNVTVLDKLSSSVFRTKEPFINTYQTHLDTFLVFKRCLHALSGKESKNFSQFRVINRLYKLINEPRLV